MIQNMTKYNTLVSIILSITALLTGINIARAQNGDQILDGIGEKGLVARYVLNGDAKDWSRNNLHAKLHGDETTFVTDTRFGKDGDHNIDCKIDGFGAIGAQVKLRAERLVISTNLIS